MSNRNQFAVSIHTMRPFSSALKLSQIVRRAAHLGSLLVLAACIPSAAPQSATPSPPLFAQPTVIPTGNWPAAVYTADVNADGSPDLIYIDHGATPTASTTHVLLNDGHGRFASGPPVTTAGSSVAIADFLGNGQAQLAYAFPVGPSNPGNVFTCASVLQINLALLNGTSRAQGTDVFQICLTGARPPVLGNFTSAKLRSGLPADLLLTDSANNVLYSVNLARGLSVAYNTAFSAPLPDGAGPIAVADVNQDGNLDAVVNGLSGNAANVFPGSPLGLLAPASPRFTGLTGVHSLLLQDVNLDGIPDLIIEGAAGHIDVFPGNGDGTFQTASIGGTGPLDGTSGNGGHLITVADLNLDGQLDALTSTPIGISTLLGQGTAYFGLKGIFNAGPGGKSYAVADFNGDGSLDLALDSPEGIAILFGNPDGTFQTSLAFAAGAPAMSSALGAFTSSGHVDAALSIAPGQAQLLLGQGDGTFAAAPASTSTPAQQLPRVWSSIALADFNNDGRLDLAVTADGIPPPGIFNGTSIQYGHGDGTFAAPLGIASHVNPGSPAYFGTGVAGPGLGLGGRAGLINLDLNHLWTISDSGQPPGPFATAIATVSDAHAHNLVAAGSLHGGSLPDLIVQDEGSLKLFLNSASGFSSAPAGDLAVDGSLTTPGQAVAPALSPAFGGTVPTSAGGLGFPAAIGSMVIADLDGDGNNDLLVAYDNLGADHTAPNSSAAPNYIYTWYGSGGGKFLATPRHPVNPLIVTPARNDYQLAVADLNRDRIPDLIMTDGYILTVAYGVGDGTFGPEQHFLAGQGINTLSVGDVNGDGVTDLVLANGGAVLTNPVANHETLASNADVNTGGITVLLNTFTAPGAAPTGTVTASPEPSAFTAAYTVTATITPPVTGGTPPGGTVAFSVDGTSLGAAVPVQNGSASITVPGTLTNPLLPGVHTLAASYVDANSNPPGNFIGTHTVSLGPTSVVLTPTTPIPVFFGGPVDGTFAITVVDSAYPATGTYTLLDNAVAVPSCTALAVNAVCPYGNPQLLDAGPHTFTLSYNGDAINAPSISPPIPYLVVPDTVSGTLASSSNPANYLSAVTFTAVFTGNLAIPFGSVQFFDGSTPIGSAALDATGTARLTISSLAVGTHPITAVFAATRDFNAATSGLVNQHIVPVPNPLPSIVLLASSLNPAPRSLPITFTATVESQGPFIQVPTGTVTFLDGSAILGTGTLNSQGIATFTTSSLAVGSHPITASYAGDTGTGAPPPSPRTGPAAPASSFGTQPSVSAVLTEVITTALTPAPEGFSLSVSPVPVTVGTGASATLLVTVHDLSSFNQPVLLGCIGLPPETVCTFAQPVILAGGGSTTLQLSTAAPHDCGNPGNPYFIGGNGSGSALPRGGGLALAALALTGAGLLRKRRRLGAIFLLAALAAGLSSLSACSRCTDLGTRPGTYTFTVTGAAQGGPITQAQAQTIQLTVTL